ncbi:MAG: HAD family hydrolase [Sedimentisphaerales bacterium]|nr:HAD family hydrolase [Sedimentisphaerales bacterium]
MTYKAVIFDLDGTLVNSLEDLADAANYALDSFGQPMHAVEAFKKMVGDGTRTLISRTLADDKQELIDKVLLKMRKKYTQICLDKTRPYKGMEETVAELAKMGVKLAVLTNKDQEMAQQIVNHFFAGFQIVKGTTAAVPVKPEPFEVLQLLEKLNVRPEEAIFVGDSGIDVQTAKAANIKAVGVSWGFRGRKELLEAGADVVIDYPYQLLELFN